MSQQKSLKQHLLDQNPDILEILTHSQLIFSIKNQDPIIKTIFTPRTIKIMFSYLNQQQPLDPNKRDLCYKLPQAAMEIMCCESHCLTDVIFDSERQGEEGNTDADTGGTDGDGKQHLVEFLLTFLDYREHYFLAGLFSKSMGSLTKRVFAPSHKYNKILCDKIFGKDGSDKCEGYLFKTFNHLYSQSMNQLVIRWLTLKSKDNDYRPQKQQYIQKLLSLINLSQGIEPQFRVLNFSEETLQSINSLIMLMLKSPLEPPPERPQPLQHKNINLLINKNSQKQLYEMVCQQSHLLSILQPIPSPRSQKLSLLRKIIQQYRTENQQLLKQEEVYRNVHLSEVVTEEMMVECLGWINELLIFVAEKIRYEDGGDGDHESKKNVTQDCRKKVDMRLLVGYLELLHEFHLLTEDLREPLTFFYQQKQKQHVAVIIKLLRLKNNIVSNLLTKIMLIVIKKLNCVDFYTALLHNGISQVIDEEGIREHVLQWAKLILQTRGEQGHVYENVNEEVQWDHMAEIVAAAEDIVIGKFRFRPANLAVFYSNDKAKEYYQEFLGQPIIIQYEEKLISKKGGSEQGDLQKLEGERVLSLKKKMSSPPVMTILNKVSQDRIKEEETTVKRMDQKQRILFLPEPEIDVLGVDSIRQGYLSYNLESLMSEVQQ